MAKRVLSGMQPSGVLHLGNLLGALDNFVRLQAEHECFYFIADWHALSTNFEDTSKIRFYVREMLIDWLAAGLDPQRSTLFIQSHVPQHAVLYLLLSMITPVPWLERNPTYKEKRENIEGRDLSTHGFLGFNGLYKAIFPEPQALLTEIPKVPGTDGRKMSKSYNNTINLSDTEAEVRAKLKTMVTDPARVRRTDKGNPDVCPVFTLHKSLSSQVVIDRVNHECRTAEIGCIDCKKLSADAIVD